MRDMTPKVELLIITKERKEVERSVATHSRIRTHDLQSVRSALKPLFYKHSPQPNMQQLTGKFVPENLLIFIIKSLVQVSKTSK